MKIEMKICKTFYGAQTVSCLKEIIQPPHTHPPPDKILLRLWKKNFLTETYGNTQTFTFKVLQECSSWASRNGAVQMFFPAPNMLAGKFLKSEMFFAVLPEHVTFNVRRVEVHKMSELL